MNRAAPVYPASARRARVQGTAVFNAIIGKNGSVISLCLANSGRVDPRLTQAAFDAISQWTYSPTLLNGQPCRGSYHDHGEIHARNNRGLGDPRIALLMMSKKGEPEMRNHAKENTGQLEKSDRFYCRNRGVGCADCECGVLTTARLRAQAPQEAGQVGAHARPANTPQWDAVSIKPCPPPTWLLRPRADAASPQITFLTV